VKAQGSRTNPKDFIPPIRAIFGDHGVIYLDLPDSPDTLERFFVSDHAAAYVVSKHRTEMSDKINRWIFSDMIPACRKVV
jgi:hypothetical protein